MEGSALSPCDREQLGRILAPYVSRIERVGLFGSRATGAARPNSDIDLVIYGSLNDADLDRLWTLCEDSSLSVSVDIVAYGPDMYPPLKRHIDNAMTVVFLPDDLRRIGSSVPSATHKDKSRPLYEA